MDRQQVLTALVLALVDEQLLDVAGGDGEGRAQLVGRHPAQAVSCGRPPSVGLGEPGRVLDRLHPATHVEHDDAGERDGGDDLDQLDSAAARRAACAEP